jgi:acyl-CoA oxidase
MRDFGSTARSVDWVRDTDSQRQLLTDRVEAMVAELAGALKDARKLSPVEAGELFNRHQDALIRAAKAHAELLQWEAFTDGVEAVADPGTKQVLTWLRDLFGLGLIEADAAWFLANGRLSGARARAITEYIETRLLPRIRRHALDLVDAFELTPDLIGAPIALGAERERQDEAAAYYAQLAASGLAPVPEKKASPEKTA